ncbi:efflux RND transporter permease subunit [Marinomonas sp. 15G1-11]|uniref:Efflux RND transporter permease subunit n=1 Tax=Marinomonas phaeophyticola TaxID=3004091 RepID=A0ABT4JPQ9_9GAMM|nr:efflux RND transporter permease subunit [Marinomonas sp. 15G1-11]MCZ2720368.1 efflux RND transporter permease subunit [Marinomonas sp. 15G1-11]
MQSLIEAALSRSRTVLMFFALILVAGVVSYIEIAKENNPDISIPVAYVSVTLEGISPEDADSLLVHPLEKELKGLEGLKQISSTASEGHASVVLEFESGTDIDQAIIDAQDKVDRAKSDLPDDADEPTVTEVNLSTFPVLRVNLSGNVDFAVLSDIAERLQDSIEAVTGVLEASINGDREQQAEIIISPAQLETYNLSLPEVISLVSQNNRLVAAGTMDTGSGRFPLKVPGLLKTEEDILNLPIKVVGNEVVLMKDIATGQLTFKEPTSYARVAGVNSITMGVSKRVGANIIETISAVKEVIKKESASWPDGIQYSLSQDESIQIETSLNDLFNNVVTSTLLVMIVIVATLGIRSAFLVGLAIPGAFLAGILILDAQGFTINMVVLFSLILSVGMLVDGAIVVTEYADRKLAEGASRRQAYGEAAKRMAWPITASTATTLAVFMPLLFWPDIVGEFMRYMPITIIATLASSLVMALIVLPTIGSIIGKKGAYTPAKMKTLQLTETGDLKKLKGFTGLYARVLTALVEYPWFVLAFAIALLLSTFAIYGSFGKGVEFFPDIEPEVAMLDVRARGDLSLDEKDALVRRVEALVLTKSELKAVITTTYSTPGNNGTPDSIGNITMEFTDWFLRRTAKEILAEIREQSQSIPGIIVEAEVQQGGPQSGADIQLELSSDYSEVLNATADIINKQLLEHDEIVSVNDDRSLPGIEWQINIDRIQASRYDVDVATLGNIIKLVTNGIVLSDFLPEGADDQIDIVLRYPINNRSMDQLDTLTIPTKHGAVPISNFITRIAAPKQGVVNRVDGKKTISINADVKDGLVIDEVIKVITQEIEEQGLPNEVSYQFRGNTEDQQNSMIFLMKAFGVAFFIMAIILVTQFNNFFQCLLILSAVIFSTMGVFMGLLIKGEPFGIVMSGVGVIALAGVVVNNNIVLIDTFNTLRKMGMSVRESAIRTGAQRLRPVILTTVTTILGLVPMVFQLNIDLVNQAISVGAPSAQWWTQLSTAIAGGLAFATPLTLILTPCLLVLGYRRAERKMELANATIKANDSSDSFQEKEIKI